MTRSTGSGLRRLLADRRGAIAIITAFVIVPLTLAVGVAVDASRIFLVRSRLSQAANSAALAAAQVTDPTTLQDDARRMFAANFPSGYMDFEHGADQRLLRRRDRPGRGHGGSDGADHPHAPGHDRQCQCRRACRRGARGEAPGAGARSRRDRLDVPALQQDRRPQGIGARPPRHPVRHPGDLGRSRHCRRPVQRPRQYRHDAYELGFGFRHMEGLRRAAQRLPGAQ